MLPHCISLFAVVTIMGIAVMLVVIAMMMMATVVMVLAMMRVVRMFCFCHHFSSFVVYCDCRYL